MAFKSKFKVLRYMVNAFQFWRATRHHQLSGIKSSAVLDTGQYTKRSVLYSGILISVEISHCLIRKRDYVLLSMEILCAVNESPIPGTLKTLPCSGAAPSRQWLTTPLCRSYMVRLRERNLLDYPSNTNSVDAGIPSAEPLYSPSGQGGIVDKPSLPGKDSGYC